MRETYQYRIAVDVHALSTPEGRERMTNVLRSGLEAALQEYGRTVDDGVPPYVDGDEKPFEMYDEYGSFVGYGVVLQMEVVLK